MNQTISSMLTKHPKPNRRRRQYDPADAFVIKLATAVAIVHAVLTIIVWTSN